MNFMSIKNWGRDGDWTTNYSGIAPASVDNGQTWGPSTQAPSALAGGRTPCPAGRFFPG